MPVNISAKDAARLGLTYPDLQPTSRDKASNFIATSKHHVSPGFWWFHVEGWPPGPNERLNWQAKRRKNQVCSEQVLWQLKGCTPAVPLQRVEVRMYLIRKGGPPCDYDNSVARIKCLQDALVKGGLVVDDSPKHLTLTVEQQFAPGVRAVRIEVLDMS